MNEKLSTILTIYDGFDLARAHIVAAMDASRTPDEIIVVNDGGDSSLRDIVAGITPKKCDIVYAEILQDIPWNYHGACNLGVWLSRGDYLAFEDKDNIPTYEFYEQALTLMKARSNVGRCRAAKRAVVSLEDMLNKPRKEWTIIKKMGPNNGTAIIRRDIFLKIKAFDEQFCGRYGWMYYDVRSRLLKITEFDQVGEYFYTMDGQTDLDRRNDPINFAHYRRNCHNETNQSPIGILNFNYVFERFPRD